MLRDFNKISYSCLWTVDEFGDAAKSYGLSFNDYYKILFNVIYHFGHLYDSVENLITMLDPNTVLDANGYQEVGRTGGNTFYWMFYNVGDYDYPDVQIVYPDE